MKIYIYDKSKEKWYKKINFVSLSFIFLFFLLFFFLFFYVIFGNFNYIDRAFFTSLIVSILISINFTISKYISNDCIIIYAIEKKKMCILTFNNLKNKYFLNLNNNNNNNFMKSLLSKKNIIDIKNSYSSFPGVNMFELNSVKSYCEKYEYFLFKCIGVDNYWTFNDEVFVNSDCQLKKKENSTRKFYLPNNDNYFEIIKFIKSQK